jgi:hypothetical protein
MLSRGLLVSLSRQGMLECLACGHENKPGDKFCAQCASSLDLRLCSVCEAMNANSDACYKCGADLRAEPQAPVPVLSDRTSRVFALSTNKRLAVLFVVPIVLLAGTFALFNGGTLSSDTGPTSTALGPAPEVRTAGWGPVQLSHSDGHTAMTAKVMSVSVAQATPAVVMERAVTSVTHTRGGPVVITVAALAPEPSREKLAAPAVAPAPVVAAPSYSRVTHTKAQQPARKPRSGSATSTAAVSLPAEQSVDSREEPAGCAPGVAALGLCINK